MTLDPNLAALLVTAVQYEKKNGHDHNGQETWDGPATLHCYVEIGVKQIETADGSVYVSQQTLIFDGNDATVQTFTLGDRFTAPGIAGGQAQEARAINPAMAPGPSLNQAMSTWLVEVVL